jgi:hypothetical protein
MVLLKNQDTSQSQHIRTKKKTYMEYEALYTASSQPPGDEIPVDVHPIEIDDNQL